MISPPCTKKADHSMTLPSLAALGGFPKLRSALKPHLCIYDKPGLCGMQCLI